MIRAFMLVTDEDQETHVVTGTIAEKSICEAESISFRETPAPHHFDWHNAPHKQFVITLCGKLHFTTSSGETFELQKGDVLLATDVKGKGHKWELLGNEPWRRAYIILKQNAADFFTPDSK